LLKIPEFLRQFPFKVQPEKIRASDRFSKSIQNVIIASFVLLGILLFGTVGYMSLENWQLLDALWMSIITMSTVGFGEVAPLDPPGRVLTIIIILSTIMVGGYAVGNIGAFVFGGEIINILRGRKLEKDIERLKDHTILVGYGRVGREAAAEWADKNLVIIESNPKNLGEAVRSGFLTIQGDATQDDTILRAGIKRARAIMIATANIADNVLVSLTARELNPNIIISVRGDDPSSEFKLKRAGANKVVLPHQIGGRRLAAFIQYPNVVDFLDFVMHGDDLSLRLQEFTIHPDSPLSGKTLAESDIIKTTGGALVMAVKPKSERLVVAPFPDYMIGEGDQLVTLGTDIMLERMKEIAK